MRQGIVFFSILIASLLFTGCRGTFEVGVERPPTPDRQAKATITALSAENKRLAELLAMQVTPTITPPILGRIAYVQGGDIWTRTLPNEKPQRLTTDGRNREPQWSPTGNWLAFRRERQTIVQRQVPCDFPRARQEFCLEAAPIVQNQVWLIEENGNNARTINSSVDHFAWSPVRDKLAYVTTDGELSAINADGTGAQVLIPTNTTDSLRGRSGRFAWSPDGNWIAYEWSVQNASESISSSSLWKISADGKNRIELFTNSSSNQNTLILTGWTSQAKSVLFWQKQPPSGPMNADTHLYRILANPGSRVEATRLSDAPTLPFADFAAPAPMGTQHGISETVAFVIGAGQGTWSNKRIDLAGRLSSQEYAAISPAWSPDGSQLAFAALPERRELNEPTLPELVQRHIWIVGADATAVPRMLTNNLSYRDEHPVWSMDGRHILFARIDGRGRASLWLISLENGGARQIIDELTPAPDPIGTYGYIDWHELFDWWRGGNG
ncbi:MAG: PD40 domain-containing protein [Chloroflexi bacterium]|nr:PD40 domain-containing protein [Chloroflexota bacterium]